MKLPAAFISAGIVQDLPGRVGLGSGPRGNGSSAHLLPGRVTGVYTSHRVSGGHTARYLQPAAGHRGR